LGKISLKPYLYKDKRYNCIRIRVRSKQFFEYVRNEIKCIRDNNDFNLGFISGLIDSDGHVNKEKRYIQFHNTDEDIMKVLKGRLDNIGLEGRIALRKRSKKDKKDSFRLYIPFKFVETKHISIKAGNQTV
jgi:intein-encoded DNA endonuclease-like protein